MQKIIILFFLILMYSCKDPEYGSKILSFAHNDAVPLSKKFAKNLLYLRWSQSINDFLVVSKEKMSNINTSLMKNPLPMDTWKVASSREDEREVIRQYKRYLALVRSLIGQDQILDDINKEIKKSKSICDDKKSFYRLGLDQDVLKNIFQINEVEADEYYYLGYSNSAEGQRDIVDKMFQSVGKFLQKKEIKRQNKNVSEALTYIQNNVIQGEELFALSSQICQTLKEKYSFSQLENYFKETKEHLGLKRKILYYRLSSIEKEVLRIGRDRVMKEYGLKEVFEKLDEMIDHYSTHLAVSLLHNEWIKKVRAERKEKDIFKKLILEDDLYKMSKSVIKDLEKIQSLQLSEDNKIIVGRDIRAAKNKRERIERIRRDRI